MMKKMYVFLAMMMLSLSAISQKAVAVWDTKCNGEGISSFKSGLVRGGLEEAVDNTPGYVKYDRAMFDAILKEQKFQRSGAVKDEDIRRMGEMAGVQYVIVPEVSLEENDFYIVVRIIDVETGQSKTAKELCKSTATEIDNACSKLAARLLGGASVLGRSDRYNALLKQGYVDLGLPSGTLWKQKAEEQHMTYSVAKDLYGNSIPTKDQWRELVNNCKWEWIDNGVWEKQDEEEEWGFIAMIDGGCGCKITGPNGNSIYLVADGIQSEDPRYNSYECWGCGGMGGVHGCYLVSSIEYFSFGINNDHGKGPFEKSFDTLSNDPDIIEKYSVVLVQSP